MKFAATPLQGAVVISLEPIADARGHFARAFCAETFAQAGLVGDFKQANCSFSAKQGTIRGLHYQLPPSAEVKLVRCTRGAIYDVIIDLRPDSPSFRQWFGLNLTAEGYEMLYVPQGCAHGFMALTDNAELSYLVSVGHDPLQERGLRHDDPAVDVRWPLPPTEISDKDRAWPDFDPGYHGIEALRGIVARP